MFIKTAFPTYHFDIPHLILVSKQPHQNSTKTLETVLIFYKQSTLLFCRCFRLYFECLFDHICLSSSSDSPLSSSSERHLIQNTSQIMRRKNKKQSLIVIPCLLYKFLKYLLVQIETVAHEI